MKNISLPLLLLALAGTPAAAQVTVNPAVLDPPVKPAEKKAQPSPRPPPAKPAQTSAKPTPQQQAAPSAVPDVPQAPPAPPVLPLPIAVTTRPAAPAGMVTITADAPGAAVALPGGLRVTFGPGQSDMTPAVSEAVRTLARSTGKLQTFNVTALAAGGGDDMSVPRRLSLARGLAIRALLINEGIASTRIYVRALGSNAEAIGTAPADRTDIMVGPTPPARPTP